VPALTLRPAPFDRVAVLRALPVGVMAVAGGAWLALLVVVLAGADLTVAAVVWVAVAGACACLGGLVAGSGGSVAPAGLLLVAAVAAAVLAAGAARSDRLPELRAADLAPRAESAPPRVTARSDATSRAAPRAGEPSHASTPSIVAPSEAEIVRAYYAALDAGQFERAWARLTPAVQARFGGYEAWRAGYATTLGHTVDAVETQPGGVVRLTLTATDRTPCGGTTTRQFAVTWQLNAGHATALSATKLAGQDPAAAC
jgi:Na+(H+)/acetate symporter ActP